MKKALLVNSFLCFSFLISSFAWAGKSSDSCETNLTSSASDASAEAPTAVLDPALEFYTDLAAETKIRPEDLQRQIQLKLRIKITTKKGLLTWLEMVQVMLTVKRTYDVKISKYRTAQVNVLRPLILKKALEVDDVRNALMEKTSAEIVSQFKNTFKRPNLAKVLEKIQTTPKELAYLLNIQGDGIYTAEQILENMLFKRARETNADDFNRIAQSLKMAYKARASKYRRTLSLEQLYYGVLEKFPNLRDSGFNMNDLSYMVGDGFLPSMIEDGKTVQIKGAVEHPLPYEFSLFKGLMDLYHRTRRDSPNQFERVVDLYKLDEAHHQKIIDQFKAHKRMIVTWAAPRVEIDKDLFNSMLEYAKEQDAFIVVVPEAGQAMELDPILLNHPNVFICINTIEFTPWLKLNALPLPGKRIDPLSNLRAPSRGGDRGVVNIVGHPQMRDEILPTADNEFFPHRLISTGSVSKAWYNSKFIIGHVTDQQARDVHMLGFLVVEKDKANSGIDGTGTANTVHTRHVEYIPESKSIIDLGRRYTAKGSVDVRPEVMVPGDDHVGHEHLEFAREKIRIIKKYRPLKYVSHDVFDGTSINHWEAQNPLIMAKKALAGELNLTQELTRVVHFMNAILSADPEIVVVIDDANHNAWLVRLLQEMQKLGQPQNDPMVAELWNAWHNLGMQPLEYFLIERAKKIMNDPDLVRRTNFVPALIDPSRVQFIDAGQSLKVGPQHRMVEIGEHGHHSGGMTKAALSLRMSAGRAYNGIVYGHTHSSGRNFRSANAGASIGKGSYAIGGPSAVDMGFVFIYGDGSLQLHHYDDKSLSWALEANDNVAPAINYEYRNRDLGITYPRVVIQEDQKMNLDTIDQFRSVMFGRD